MPAVLIVDDDADIRLALSDLLTDEQYETITATNGLAALACLRQSAQPLIVLVDLSMPQLDGIGFLRQVQADPHLADTHAYIVMTARERTFPLALVQQMRQLHISFLSKPFDIEQVIALIAQAAQRLPAS